MLQKSSREISGSEFGRIRALLAAIAEVAVNRALEATPITDEAIAAELLADERECEGRLLSVEAVAGADPPRWVWTFETPDSGRRELVTVITERAYWRLAMVFEAFGVPLDTDTAELWGRRVRLQLTEDGQIARVLPRAEGALR